MLVSRHADVAWAGRPAARAWDGMLFNSYAFILGFMPMTLLLFHGLRGAGFARSSIGLLALLSLVFYGWWNPIYLLLIVPLMLVNFVLAARIVPRDGRRPHAARPVLVLGIVLNLATLGYFKYANFFVDNLNAVAGLDLALGTVVLPIGISFFTFQKIAFLVDAYRNRVDRLDFIDYVLFVTFFPQLIAGPIVHHSEVIRQFRDQTPVSLQTVALGVTIFTIGLAKKVLLADTAALYASPLFDAVAAGAHPDVLAAWGSALAYTAQLYFDFSGYSDMAIGGGLLFGIRLPLNFASPYKAESIIEFWHRRPDAAGDDREQRSGASGVARGSLARPPRGTRPGRHRCRAARFGRAPGNRLVRAEHAGADRLRGSGRRLCGEGGVSAITSQVAAIGRLGGGHRVPVRHRADADVEGFGVHLFSVLRRGPWFHSRDPRLPGTAGSWRRPRPCCWPRSSP